MRRWTLFVLPALAGVLAAQDPAPQALDWKDLTKSGLPIRFYGFFRLDAYYNSARMNSVILPATVQPENGTTAKPNDDAFFLDPRLTRFGFDITPVSVGEGTLTGKLETDFANFPSGGTESRATPRIRLAYIDIEQGDFGLRLGQDWDVISPLYPAVNHELLMWNAGNVGDRRAQIQGRYAPEGSPLEFKASLGLTGAINNQDLDPTVAGVSTERDGFDSGMPHLQVRGGLRQEMWVEGQPAVLGAWGSLGRTETDTAINGQTRFDIWLAGVDFQVPLTTELSLRGEAWVGENLGDFRGGIGQTVNATNGREIASIGGWGELVCKVGDATKVHVGASVDDPDNADLNANNPKRNLTGYVGTVHDWDNGLRTGLDVIYWETDWMGLGTGNAVRVDLSFSLSF